MVPADKSQTAARIAADEPRPFLAAGPPPSFVCVLLESMCEAVCVCDDKGRIVYTNPAEDRMFGYDPGELPGNALTGLTPDVTEQLQQTGEWEGERLNYRKDGTAFYTKARMRRFEQDGLTYWICIHEDITEKRRVESDLRSANQSLHALIRASPLPIVAFNRDGLIQLWNSAAEHLFGWTEEEVLGKPLPFIPEEKRSEHLSMRQRDLSGAGFVNREVRRRKKDGTPIDISVSTAPMYDTAGQVTGIMSVYVDITEQRKYGETQRQALDLLLQNEAQLTLLVEASSVLLASPESEQVLDKILNLARRFVHAEAYAVWRKTGDTWRLMVSAGLSDGYERIIPPERANEIRIPDEPLAVEDVLRHPSLGARADLYRAEGIASILSIPLRIHGQVGGTIVFYYRARHRFSDTEQRIAGALGNLAAAALSAAETYERQAELRALAESAERRASFLAAVSEELVSSLEYEVTLTKVAKLAVPEFADWCAVDVLQPDGEVRRLAVEHIDPAKVEFAYEYARRYPTREEEFSRVAMRTGNPVLITEVPDEMLVEHARDAEHLALIRSLGLQSVIGAPMVVRGRTLGLITFVSSETGRHFTNQDLSMAMEIARRAAVAVDNARLFREVRESEERFRRLYESNILAVSFWNTDGVVTSANDAYLQIVGISREAFESSGGIRFDAVTAQEYHEIDAAIVRECRDFGCSGVHEKEYVRPDGSRAAVLIAAAFLNSRRKEGVAFIVDITDRKKLDRQFRGVADAAIAISAGRTVADVLRSVNDRIRGLVACRKSEILLSSEAAEVSRGDLNVPMKDRSGKVLGVIRLWAQEPQGFTGTDRSIIVQLAEMASIAIENTELNESLRKSNEELQRANEDLNQFAYSASHDLQEPLRMISIYTQLLGKRFSDSVDEEIRDSMRFTLDGAKRMELLIRDLLAYTHAVNIRGVPDAPVAAEAALEKAMANLRRAIESSGAQICASTLPPVRVFEIHLVQLFQNLIGNAIKYRGPNPPAIQISAVHEENYGRWRFCVQDNGIGIAPRYHQQVFGLFKRLYPAHQYPGTGIGLAICQKVVERYGGRIWVESEEGKGSTFRFTLPE